MGKFLRGPSRFLSSQITISRTPVINTEPFLTLAFCSRPGPPPLKFSNIFIDKFEDSYGSQYLLMVSKNFVSLIHRLGGIRTYNPCFGWKTSNAIQCTDSQWSEFNWTTASGSFGKAINNILLNCMNSIDGIRTTTSVLVTMFYVALTCLAGFEPMTRGTFCLMHLINPFLTRFGPLKSQIV